jgi:hypothetical protein
VENTPCIGKYPLSWKIPPVLENTLCVEKYPHIGKYPIPHGGKEMSANVIWGKKYEKGGKYGNLYKYAVPRHFSGMFRVGRSILD